MTMQTTNFHYKAICDTTTTRGKSKRSRRPFYGAANCQTIPGNCFSFYDITVFCIKT